MATNYISKRIAEGILLDYFPDPTPSEFESEIVRAYKLIGLEVGSLSDAELRCLKSEVSEVSAALHPTLSTIGMDQLQIDYVFSIYYMLLVQQFAMTLAHDSSMKRAVRRAMDQLALQPGQVVALGQRAARLHAE